MTETNGLGGWAKAGIIAILAVIVVGIFSAGAVYQEFSVMKSEVVGIHDDIRELVKEQAALNSRLDQGADHERRIELLEEEVRRLK